MYPHMYVHIYLYIYIYIYVYSYACTYGYVQASHTHWGTLNPYSESILRGRESPHIKLATHTDHHHHYHHWQYRLQVEASSVSFGALGFLVSHQHPHQHMVFANMHILHALELFDSLCRIDTKHINKLH